MRSRTTLVSVNTEEAYLLVDLNNHYKSYDHQVTAPIRSLADNAPMHFVPCAAAVEFTSFYPVFRWFSHACSVMSTTTPSFSNQTFC